MRQKNFLSRLYTALRGLFTRPPAATRAHLELSAAVNLPEPVVRKIGLLIIDPFVSNGTRLSQFMGWHDPDQLISAFITDLHEVSHGYVQYEIADRMLSDEFPVKEDGFQYTADDYLSRWQARSPFHTPDAVDYHRIIDRFALVEKVNGGSIDEVWAICFPWGGFYESRMIGPGAFWCNAPPLTPHATAERRFVIMCFNYERGVGEMLESFGHRAESIMDAVYQGKPDPENFWRRFTLYDKIAPGRAEAGNIHFAPNSQRDYDWGNRTKVPSRCRTWEHFPDLTGELEMVNCSEWGKGDIRLHHRWWFRLIPHVQGMTAGISNNWWQYIVDPNLA